MNTIWTIARYEWLHLIERPSRVIMLFFMPLLLIFILGHALSSDFSDTRTQLGTIRLALYVGDQEGIRKSLPAYLLQGGEEEEARFQIHWADSPEQVERMLRKNEADMGLISPNGFEANLSKGEAPAWKVIEGQDLWRNLIGQKELQAYFRDRVLSSAVSLQNDGHDAAITGAPHTLESSEEPFVLHRVWKDVARPLTALQYYGAHMLVMFMQFGGMACSISLVSEKRMHTLTRLRSMPLRPSQLLLGKVSGHLAILMVQAILVVGGCALIYGLDWGSNLLILFLILLLIAIFTVALGAVLGMIASTPRVVIGVFQTTIMLMTAVSGGFTPDVGETLTRFGKLTVSYWSSDAMTKLMLQGNVSGLTGHVLVLSGMAAAMAAIALLAARKVGYHE